jgi:hypothetical protein
MELTTYGATGSGPTGSEPTVSGEECASGMAWTTSCRTFEGQRLLARRRTAEKFSGFRGSDVSHMSPRTLQFRHFGCWASQRTLRFRHWLQARATRIGLSCVEAPPAAEGPCLSWAGVSSDGERERKWLGNGIENELRDCRKRVCVCLTCWRTEPEHFLIFVGRK